MGPINDTRYPQGNYGCVKNIWSESRYLNSKNFNLFHVAKLCQILRASSFCWTFSVASFLTSTPRRPTPTFLWRPPNTSRTWGPTPPMTSSRLSSLRTWMTFSWCFNLFSVPTKIFCSILSKFLKDSIRILACCSLRSLFGNFMLREKFLVWVLSNTFRELLVNRIWFIAISNYGWSEVLLYFTEHWIFVNLTVRQPDILPTDDSLNGCAPIDR